MHIVTQAEVPTLHDIERVITAVDMQRLGRVASTDEPQHVKVVRFKRRTTTLSELFDISFDATPIGPDASMSELCETTRELIADRARKLAEMRTDLAEIVEVITGIEQAEIADDLRWSDDLDIDSVSMICIAVDAEDLWDIKIPDEELSKRPTVGDFLVYAYHKRFS